MRHKILFECFQPEHRVHSQRFLPGVPFQTAQNKKEKEKMEVRLGTEKERQN